MIRSLLRCDSDTGELEIYTQVGVYAKVFDATVGDEKLRRKIIGAIRMAEKNAYEAALTDVRQAIAAMGNPCAP